MPVSENSADARPGLVNTVTVSEVRASAAPMVNTFVIPHLAIQKAAMADQLRTSNSQGNQCCL
jgi:hypothetical protein